MALFACATLASCKDHSQTLARGRGVAESQRAEGPLVDPAVDPAAPTRRRDSDDEEPSDEPEAEAAAPEEAPAQVRVRDLGYELHEAFGDPGACLGSLPPSVTSVRISVSGSVGRDGTVLGANVSSSYRDDAVLRCLRGMATSLRIEGDVPGAPRTISTTVDVQR